MYTIQQVKKSQYERPSTRVQFTFVSARLSILCACFNIHQYNDFIFFSVFLMVSLKILTLLIHLSLIATSPLKSSRFYHPNQKKKRFFDVPAGGELING